MVYDRILIRYGELTLKGKNRNIFIDKLKVNIKQVLKDFPNAKVQSRRDRMYILLNGEDGQAIMEKLKDIFGIQSFSPAIKTEKNIEEMKKAALILFQSVYKEGDTFKISAKRADKTFPLKTNDMNNLFGAHLLKNFPGLKVDVKHPDIDLCIEVRDDGAFFSCENIPGAGGLPSCTSGKAMLMLSGGIDSPVAGYLAMKRGIEIEAIHFFSPPFTSDRAKQKVIELCEKLAPYQGNRLILHIVPFTEIQQLIRQKIPEGYTMTTMRRLMLKIADRIKEENNGLAIITGESVGQVASQTLHSMVAINEVTNTPVLRPLITLDKTEIIQIAQKIDTLEISNQPFEDCCTIFVPSKPKTKPNKEKVLAFEQDVDFEPFIKEAIEKKETLIIHPKSIREENEFKDLF